MSATDRICQIPVNSDIAGIGVRASVYIQACLAGLNLLYMLHTRLYSDIPRVDEEVGMDPPKSGSPDLGSTTALDDAATADVADIALRSRPPSQQSTPTSFIPKESNSDLADAEAFRAFVRSNREYIDMIKGLERTLFMVGFAVILSAIIEAKSSGLTPYHALIVLNISQINNWAGFLLLVVRGGFRPSERGGWARYFLVTRDSLVSSIPCMAHAFMMSGLGLYFWSDLRPFLGYAAEQPCQPLTYFWLFGSIDVSNDALRISSLVFYAICAVPVVGLYFLGAILVFALLTFICGFTILVFVLCIAIMISIMLYYLFIYPIVALVLRPLYRTLFVQSILVSLSRPLSFIARGLHSIRLSLHSRTTALLVGPSYSQLFTFPIGVFFSFPLFFAIVSTELTIRINNVNLGSQAENKWTYGQTLALFSALVAVVLYLNEQVKMMRKWRRKMLEARTGTVTAVREGLRVRPVFVERDTQTEDDVLGA